MTQTAQPNREQILAAKQSFARYYNSTDPGKDKAFEQVVRDNWKRNQVETKGTPDEIEQMKVMAAIAAQSSDDDFVHFVTTGEPPTVKLTPRQLETARGGWPVLRLLAACTTAAVGAAMVVGDEIYQATGADWW